MTTNLNNFSILSGISSWLSFYDVFILDLWGVVFDGATVYPEAIKALSNLRLSGKLVVLLSNAPRRTPDLIESIKRVGLPPTLYNDILSSGEVLHTMIHHNYASLGQRCWHLGPNKDRSVFESLEVILVSEPQEATFIVNTGPREFHETIDDYKEQLLQCRRYDLPMICANPDKVVTRMGKQIMCAGTISALYEELGGKVSYCGKPDPTIYSLCLQRLGFSLRHRVLIVGDAIETDISGAAAARIDAVLVTCGVHSTELKVHYNEYADPVRVSSLLGRYHLECQGVLPAFVW